MPEAGHGSFREPEVEAMLIRYLEASGYKVVTRPRTPSGYPDIVAEGPDGKWLIEVKGEDAGGYTSAEMNFQMGLGQIMCRMVDPGASYGLAFPWTTDFKKVLRTYRGSDGFNRLGLYLFVVHRDGSVGRYDCRALERFLETL
jgi:hypothetical protein